MSEEEVNSVISSDTAVVVSESPDEEYPVKGTPMKPSVGVFLTEQASTDPSSKIVVRPGVEQHFRPEDRRLTFRYISSAEFYKNRIFKQSRDSMRVLKTITDIVKTRSGSIQTDELPSILQEAGLEMNTEIESSSTKLTEKLQKAHGSELSMMVSSDKQTIVGYKRKIYW